MTGVAAYEIREAAKTLEKVIADAFESNNAEVLATAGEGDYGFHN
jgi:hypothetical protein